MNMSKDEKWQWIEAAQGMRVQLLDLLSDSDMAFTPGGQNMTLEALYREMGDIEYTYIQSLKGLKQEWSYRSTDTLDSLARVKAWLQALDEQLGALVVAFSEEDMSRQVDRGGEAVTVAFQLDVYLQAVLIFLGKASIYMRALDRPLPQLFLEYIG